LVSWFVLSIITPKSERILEISKKRWIYSLSRLVFFFSKEPIVGSSTCFRELFSFFQRNSSERDFFSLQITPRQQPCVRCVGRESTANIYYPSPRLSGKFMSAHSKIWYITYTRAWRARINYNQNRALVMTEAETFTERERGKSDIGPVRRRGSKRNSSGHSHTHTHTHG